jgi:hypothetical protein
MTTSAVFPSVCDAKGEWHIEPSVRRAMKAFVGASLKNTVVEIVIRKQRRDRTTAQVAYYWATVVPQFAQHEGYRRDEHYMLHDGLMHKFWPLEPDKVTKAPRRRRLSLKDGSGPEPPLSDEEMGIHIEQVVLFAAERGCVIPDAETQAA